VTTRYLFLDIDGVLNSAPWATIRDNEPGAKRPIMLNEFDPLCVQKLEVLVKRLQPCQVVLSSTWRLHYTPPEMVAMLAPFGYSGGLIDRTPKLGSFRGYEIQEWMNQNLVEAHQIVILDDDDDMVHLKPRHVRTSFYKAGLCDVHVNQALKLFGLPPLEEPIHAEDQVPHRFRIIDFPALAAQLRQEHEAEAQG
jgi:hypothetical protein